MKGYTKVYTMFCVEAYETDIMFKRRCFNDTVH